MPKTIQTPQSKLTTSRVDNRRRIVLPDDLPPGCVVSIQEVGPDTFLVQRVKPKAAVKLLAIPIIKDLPDDPEWEKKEAKFARHLFKRLPKFEE